MEGIKTLPGKSPRQNVPLGWGWPMLGQVFSAVSLLPLLLLSPPSFPRDWFLINILYPKLKFLENVSCNTELKEAQTGADFSEVS